MVQGEISGEQLMRSIMWIAGRFASIDLCVLLHCAALPKSFNKVQYSITLLYYTAILPCIVSCFEASHCAIFLNITPFLNDTLYCLIWGRCTHIVAQSRIAYQSIAHGTVQKNCTNLFRTFREQIPLQL